MISGLLIQDKQRLNIFQKYILIRLQQKLVDKGMACSFKILKQNVKAQKNEELLSTHPDIDINNAQLKTQITEVEITIQKVKLSSQEIQAFQQIKDVRNLRTHKKKILVEYEKNRLTQEAELKKYFKNDEKEQLNQILNLKNLIIQTKNDRAPSIRCIKQQENYFSEIIISITILLFILTIMILVF